MMPLKDPLAPGTANDNLGVVLIAHGSRRREANQELHTVAEGLRGRGINRVHASFLELAEPAIFDAGCACVESGATRVILLPYFLSAGRHVTKDLEEARLQLMQRFPGIEFLLAGPLGPHPLLEQILIERIGSVTEK